MANTEGGGMPLLKDLASSDTKIRRLATQNVFTHIASPTRTDPYDHMQCLQIWRALFVALLMHDSKNQLSVQKLILSMTEQFQVVTEMDDDRREAEIDCADEIMTFTSAFWETVAREWSGVDRLRMDKVLLLVRMAIRQLFQISLATSTGVVISRLVSQIEIFEAWPLSPRERKVPDGLRYHVLDVWVDELARCKQEFDKPTKGADGEDQASESEESPYAEGVKLLMGPVEKIAKDGLSKNVRTRAKETLLDAQAKLGVGG